MGKHYGLLNFLLSITVLFLFIKNYETWIKHDLGPIAKGENKRSESKGAGIPLLSTLSSPKFDASSLPTIAGKNIFHPERREFISLSPEQPKAMPINRPQIQLQGILINEEVQKASLILQGKSLPKGEKAVRTLSLGDQIGEYKLTKILPDRIVFEAPGDVYEVFLYDLKSPKKRMGTRTAIRPPEPISPSPGRPEPTPRIHQTPQTPSGPVREIHPPTYQPPSPPGSTSPPGALLSPPRRPPLPGEISGGKN